MAMLSSGPWWAAVITTHRAELVDAIVTELGAIRARHVDLEVTADALVVRIVTGDRDTRLVEQLTESVLLRVLPDTIPARVEVTGSEAPRPIFHPINQRSTPDTSGQRNRT